jgi:hypothetical protein
MKMDVDTVSTACEKAWHTLDFSVCKPLGLDVATWIAVLTALVGALLFVWRQIIRLRRASTTGDSRISGTLWRSRFRNLCRAIQPHMDENYRIFCQFGPNSGQSDGLPKIVRFELGVWYQLRKKIVENNKLIRELIVSNLEAIPLEHSPIFRQWLDHIDAFYAHTLDPLADYREHQFPTLASELVTRYA